MKHYLIEQIFYMPMRFGKLQSVVMFTGSTYQVHEEHPRVSLIINPMDFMILHTFVSLFSWTLAVDQSK